MNRQHMSRRKRLKRSKTARLIALAMAAAAPLLCPGKTASGHHPEYQNQPVYPRIDVIPPLGNNLPAGYRRTYNRPTYWGGRLAYKFNPTSQEAMAWHRADHRGDYDCNRGRYVPFYQYLKPWEAIKVGARPKPKGDATEGIESIDDEILDDPPELEPQGLDELIEPLGEDLPTPSQMREERVEQERMEVENDSLSLPVPDTSVPDQTLPLDEQPDIRGEEDVRSSSDFSNLLNGRP